MEIQHATIKISADTTHHIWRFEIQPISARNTGGTGSDNTLEGALEKASRMVVHLLDMEPTPKVCAHCHLPLAICQKQEWTGEVINRTRINFRWDEECKCFIAEFPRILTQAETKERATESLKRIVKMTAHTLETGEVPEQKQPKIP